MAKSTIPFPQFTLQQIERFWNKVDKTPGQGPQGTCWIWTASTNKKGYGKFRADKRLYHAHRLAYFLATSIDPGSLNVLHRCDYPTCVNPAHLFDGTQSDNIRDCVVKGRVQKGDQHWSRRNPELVARGNRSGSRLHPEKTPRGERHFMAKLTEQNVRTIRQQYATGHFTYDTLAKLYQCSMSLIGMVVQNKIWQHVV